MKVIRLTRSDGRRFHVVASQIAVFFLSVYGDKTVILLSGGANHDNDGDLWVVESPEEIERLLTEEE